MQYTVSTVGFHDGALASDERFATSRLTQPQFQYTFENFFHPFVGELIAKLNRDSLAGMLDATWQDTLKKEFFEALYRPAKSVISFPKEIDVAEHGLYANYNWELLFHIPLSIAVHLSKNQRFAEAQRWFHYIFDPTSNDHTVDPPKRFWKFLAFRQDKDPKQIDYLLKILSTPKPELSPDDLKLRDSILQGYNAIRDKPFQPHAVARTRRLAYQYCVVMKYLDNLIAWGDHLFQQDTVESINEATQRYVLAANLLGPRPQRIPPRGTVKAKTFKDLKDAKGLDPMGNALVELEGQLPFNFASTPSGDGAASPLLGIKPTLYFCIPRNDKMLGYWDTVADRLFKIRHCMNIEGVVRPLALFDPPIDPGMLVKAAAAGIDIGSIVSGLNQPIGPVRSLMLIQKALELASEVRALGNALLAALEKGDGERLGLIRQSHEIQIQQMAQEVRFLQWKSAQEATKSLLTTRATALERLHYYQGLLGLPADQNAPDTIVLDQSAKPDDPPKLTGENFDEAFGALVGQYNKTLTIQQLPKLTIIGDTSPAQQSGASGQGRLYLNPNEDAELNSHSAKAQNSRDWASRLDMSASTLAALPGFNINMHFWGLGTAVDIPLGTMLSNAAKAVSSHFSNDALREDRAGQNASKTGSYERRADEWLLQYNLAAHELMQIGRQILTSLIAEQIALHEYHTTRQQIANAQKVDQFLHDKFTNEELYGWMQGEISRLYYEYYRFAFDTARKAEKTMKQELMRPELDAKDFVKFNYWDGGRKGLLSGEALYLDVKRMEMAYHDNNRRELELTRHVSLRQLDPLALLTLKVTGTCQVTVPEWLYDRDCPGHYMRRIKTVALSIPSVVGPYATVNCTLSLLKSSVRKSPLLKDSEYTRQGTEDDRFADYAGSVQSIVTSSANNDSGLFETNLRDERFLPFEGAGGISTWKLELPADYPSFDYSTISDVILHIRYTARQGVTPIAAVKNSLDELFPTANLMLMFSLRHDFPTEWALFVSGAGDFKATIRRDQFPYFTQGKGRSISVTSLDLYGSDGAGTLTHRTLEDKVVWDEDKPLAVTLAKDPKVLIPDPNAQVFLIIRYTF